MPSKPTIDRRTARKKAFEEFSESAQDARRESERKSLAVPLAQVGPLNDLSVVDVGDDVETLASLRERISKNDRHAMLQTLSLVARVLYAYESLSEEARIGIGNAICEMIHQLRGDGFLPKKLGRPKNEAERGDFASKPLKTAIAVEWRRRQGDTWDAAIINTAEAQRLNEATVKKYANAQHKTAKAIWATLEALQPAILLAKNAGKVTKKR